VHSRPVVWRPSGRRPHVFTGNHHAVCKLVATVGRQIPFRENWGADSAAEEACRHTEMQSAMTVRHCLYLTAFVAIATISDASSGWNYPSKGSAFVSGMPMQLRGRSGVVGLSSCAQRGDSAVDRRFFLASFALGLSGVLPAVSSAQQLSAKEAEEYAKLLEQVPAIYSFQCCFIGIYCKSRHKWYNHRLIMNSKACFNMLVYKALSTCPKGLSRCDSSAGEAHPGRL
jgi:hypothetical protein